MINKIIGSRRIHSVYQKLAQFKVCTECGKIQCLSLMLFSNLKNLKKLAQWINIECKQIVRKVGLLKY